MFGPVIDEIFKAVTMHFVYLEKSTFMFDDLFLLKNDHNCIASSDWRELVICMNKIV